MSGAYGFDGGGYGSYSGDGGYGANRGGGRGGGGGGGYGGGGGGYEGERGGRVGRGSSGGGSRGGGRSSGSEREGDWRCPNPGGFRCGNLNFARRVECNKCGTASPGGGGGGGGGGMRGGLGGGFESSRGRGGSYYDGGSGRAGSDYDGRNTRSGSYGSSQGRDDGGSFSYAPDAVPPPSSYDGGPASFPQSYGAPRYGGDSRNDSRGGMRSGASGGYEGENRNPSGGYGGCQSDAPVAVKQCDENCGDSCDNSRIYLSNLPPNVTVDELRELFGSIGQVARIKQKRGYKDQWPWSIKIYTDEQGKNKGDAVLSYEDPSAAHSAGGFFNNHELRGHKISVAMAEKSAPKAPSSYGSGGGGGRGGYGGDRRRDNFRDGGSGPNRNYHGGNRSNPY